MNETRTDMHNVHNAFWHENQVVVTLGSDIPILSDAGSPTSNKQTIIRSLNLQSLNDFLTDKLKLRLRSFSDEDTLRPVESSPSKLPPSNNADTHTDLNSPIGKYLFSSVKGEGEIKTNVISFFHFDPVNGTLPSMARPTSETASVPETGSVHDPHGKGNYYVVSSVPQVVNLINANLRELRDQGIPIIASSPHWLTGATQRESPVPQGCPIIPPFPVPADLSCPSSPSLWPITLPDLSSELQSMTGDGVTVFILDTLPKRGEISRVAEGAEENNLLLLDVDKDITFNYNILSDALDIPSPDQPAVAKDIHGRHAVFRMPDHGLFIAGIVRDLAPDSRVECIRMLNDFCAGDMAMLTKALENIHDRMLQIDPNTLKKGDLYNKPVVINMSLVVPTDEEAQGKGLNTADEIRTNLLKPIQGLVGLGAVFVASAGNEADERENPSGKRPVALYPAAFANPPDSVDGIIPVGAVKKNGKATSYSCYPGPNGVATYGGEIPTPVEPDSPDDMTGAIDIDALIGIYSSLSYPALSVDDPQPRYPVPSANAWAYWVGTSFATPIISAVAARVLELRLRSKQTSNVSAPQFIINSVAKREVMWDNLDSSVSPSGSASGRMILAEQCVADDEDDEEEEVVEVIIPLSFDVSTAKRMRTTRMRRRRK